jgi:hypothetical protein
MSRYQNSGSQPAARTRGPRRGGRDGAPAWSTAWTAAATSCAVSASMTMFRWSSTRRTTCPACGGASCGPMVPGQGPVASAFRGIGAGSVTPGTEEETVLVRLLDTPDLQRLLRRSPGGARPVRDPAGDHVLKVRFSTRRQRGRLRRCRGAHASRFRRPGSSQTVAVAPLSGPGPCLISGSASRPILCSPPRGRSTYSAIWATCLSPWECLSLDPPMILKAGSRSPRSDPRYPFQEAALTRCSRQQRQSGR